MTADRSKDRDQHRLSPVQGPAGDTLLFATLQREAVGPGGAGVDGPRLVDHSREVQQPLGESGLTGVDVGEDAQVQ